MKLAWISNAPWCPSGYGVQTALVCERLKRFGHDVAILANVGLEGGELSWQGISVLPRPGGGNVAPYVTEQLQRLGIDAVITCYDSWATNAATMGPRWCPWFPMDREPLAKLVLERVKESFFPICFSKWGMEATSAAGVPCWHIPLCVDTQAYAPMDRAEARNTLHFPDAYIVGIVADNRTNPSRKALAQQIEAFARFRRDACKDALLYLHTCLDASRGGIDIAALIQHLGIEDAVIQCDQVPYMTTGFPQWYMRAVYCGIDLLMNVSADEGFGCALIEAQACGTPVLAGNWMSMSELVCAGAVLPKGEADPVWTSSGGYQYIPRIERLAELMATAREMTFDREAARDFALEYDADQVVLKQWMPALEEVEERIGMEPTFAEAIHA